ncbi:MAG: hypothetical protein PHF46_05075, partial [Candidatus Gracilibacteria bacterium]|nr:hypothetical protein [Candidatus Gracilibacteria bacterium]MDD3120750.1 hypothetical protein [Candidatus Gracilibacteria bacterium]MDD4530985.1 hypothetical protein [Candidatus Gracilibacteria bacterium]
MQEKRNSTYINIIKKFTSLMLIIGVFFSNINISLLLDNIAYAAPNPAGKISPHRAVTLNANKISKTYPSYIITSSGNSSEAIKLFNPYGADIANLDLDISTTTPNSYFSSGGEWSTGSLSFSGFNIETNSFYFKNTNTASGDININYSLTESGNTFTYTGTIILPFDTFNPKENGNYYSDFGVNSLQMKGTKISGMTTPIIVNPSLTKNIVITSTPQTITEGKPSGMYSIQLQNQSGTL